MEPKPTLALTQSPRVLPFMPWPLLQLIETMSSSATCQSRTHLLQSSKAHENLKVISLLSSFRKFAPQAKKRAPLPPYRQVISSQTLSKKKEFTTENGTNALQ